MLNSEFNDFAKNKIDLNPAELQEAQASVDSWIYEGINNGVYKCGFAKTQEAYDQAIVNLFSHMDKLEAYLADNKYMASEFCLSDIKLLPTLLRFDEVYVVYFKCDKRKVSEYPNMMRYLRDCWKIPGLKETTKMDHIKTHYYSSHAHLNPFGIVPVGPDFIAKLQ